MIHIPSHTFLFVGSPLKARGSAATNKANKANRANRAAPGLKTDQSQQSSCGAAPRIVCSALRRATVKLGSWYSSRPFRRKGRWIGRQSIKSCWLSFLASYLATSGAKGFLVSILCVVLLQKKESHVISIDKYSLAFPNEKKSSGYEAQNIKRNTPSGHLTHPSRGGIWIKPCINLLRAVLCNGVPCLILQEYQRKKAGRKWKE